MKRPDPGTVEVLPDGTHHYSNGFRYTPVPDEERKYQRRKPDHPDAFRIKGDWFIPHEFLPDDQREMPETLTRSSSRGRRALRRRAKLRLLAERRAAESTEDPSP